MATINSKTTVDHIIAHNGEYEGDPTVVKIVKYNNHFNGKVAYGLTYEGEPLNRYEESPFCHNCETIFERK